jgi:tail protein P2 I
MSTNNRPNAGSFAVALWDQMLPLTYAEDLYGYPLLTYLDGIGQMLQDLDTLSHSDIPWEGMLDLDTIRFDALQWLGQFLGVVVDKSLTEDEQRQQIRDHAGWQRGTPKAFMDAIRSKLTLTKTVELHERDTDAYHFTVVTYGDETPTADWPVANLVSNPSFETDTSGWYVL